jgi:hypothetical protein
VTARFCPNCGTPRVEGARFCASCGLAFDQMAPAAAPILASGGAGSITTATFAGLAWLTTAALMGYLAFEQWSYSSFVPALAADALVNALFALVTAYFGARCLQRPRRQALTNAAVWAALNVAWGVYQVVNRTTYELFYLVLIATAVAGVLSFVGREQVPA